MTYSEVLQYMFDQLPMFHRIGHNAYKANLDTALFLDEIYQHPHLNYKTIHVAGTNGKGSVSHMLASILQKAGYKTGLFTSPHLKDFRERIRVNGAMIPENEVVSFIENGRSAFAQTQPSFFEMTSALAFHYFAKTNVDIAVIEVGMGGRLDSTNIINPLLSVITNIGLDHTEFLGDTLAQIAAEKAGIIKDKVPVVIGEYHTETWAVFNDIAQKQDAEIILADEQFKAAYSLFTPDRKQTFSIQQNGEVVYPNLALDLQGFYQRKNICTVLAAIHKLRETGIPISKDAIYDGLTHTSSTTGLNGRWQALGFNPLIICDTGHNKDGIAWVVKQIEEIPYKNLHMVIGFVKDKDIRSVLQLLPSKATYYFTNAQIPRALRASELQALAKNFGLEGKSYTSVSDALTTAKNNASPEDFIFVGGSTFIVAEAI